jgi:hypothetical protein
MDAKLLNLPDAMKLASILSKYIDTVSFNPEQGALDFVGDLLDKIEPMDYMNCIRLLLEEPQKISHLSGDELLTLLFHGLEKNKIFSLLDAYKNIGFT